MKKQQKPEAAEEQSLGGRPPYRPSVDDRNTVEQMKFCGEPHTVIARALRIDVRTLEKHFVDELENGHANRRRDLIGWMFETAEKGNASIQKHLDQMGRAADADEAVKGRGKVKAKEPLVGKKEARQQAAEKVAGKFAPPAPPQRLQ